MDAPWDSAAGPSLDEGQVLSEYRDTSEPYVGRWNRLISQTNWEKGRIIFEWRTALEQQGAPIAAFSDEAWARQVGGVTPQHVGRLRRVYQRFGEIQTEFPGLYWSHFQVALDWEDAEMWLEGAVQNGWSVAQMRQQRAKTLGLVEDVLSPVETTVAIDEDLAEPHGKPDIASDRNPAREEPSAESVERAASGVAGPAADATVGDVGEPSAVEAEEEPQRPFAELPSLPDDLQDALEAFKLAILRHKSSGWEEVQPSDVLAVLRSLEALVTAP